MKAYKASYDGKCLSLNYEVGKTYTFNGKLIICQQGFHFCKKLKNVFIYYPNSKELVVFEIETLGKVITEEDKSVSDKIKILRILTKNEYEKFIPVNEYDQNNNMIHSKNLDNFEEWKEYDENNNMIHYKNSNGISWKIEIEK